MFARKGRLPVDINTENQHEPDNKVEDFFAADEPDEEQIAGKREEMNALVKLNIQKAQQKQKQYYDKKHGAASCFTTGAVVLKKDFRRKKRRGGKIDKRWQGPYVITASHGKGLFRLQEVGGQKVGFC